MNVMKDWMLDEKPTDPHEKRGCSNEQRHLQESETLIWIYQCRNSVCEYRNKISRLDFIERRSKMEKRQVGFVVPIVVLPTMLVSLLPRRKICKSTQNGHNDTIIDHKYLILYSFSHFGRNSTCIQQKMVLTHLLRSSLIIIIIIIERVHHLLSLPIDRFFFAILSTAFAEQIVAIIL